MINVAELLKDCPQGMELDCTMFDDCTFLDVDEKANDYVIRITTPCGIKFIDRYGRYIANYKAKCVIFPKGKTTWEGFVPPCKFKDGDVISNSLGTCIFKGEGKLKGTVDYYCGIASFDTFRVKDEKSNPFGHYGNIADYRLATEEEKDALFKIIEHNGYRWDPETKTLEKLFKPKFKVGDYVAKKGGITVPVLITGVGNELYYSNTGNSVGFFRIKEQDDWELVPQKFDMNTLVPFESRVLVRSDSCKLWKPAIFGCCLEGAHSPYYALGGTCYKYCIPYEGNEHLLGKVDDSDEFYENW